MAMKILTTRSDVATAVRTMPVLRVDLARRSESNFGTEGACFRFDDGRLNPYTHQPMTTRHELKLFDDNVLLSITEPCVALVNEMTYSDWDQVLNFVNVPVLHDREQFVLVLENSAAHRMVFVVLTMRKAPLGGIYIEEFSMANREAVMPQMSSLLKCLGREIR